MKQRPGENARLYAARYEVIHFRVNQLMAEEQNQSGEMMFYSGTLQDHLRRKLLKRIHSTFRSLRNLCEGFDLTLEFEKEYQITKPQTDFAVKETCYKVNNKVCICKVTDPNIRSSNIKSSKTMTRSITKVTKTELVTTKATSPSIRKDPSNSSK